MRKSKYLNCYLSEPGCQCDNCGTSDLNFVHRFHVDGGMSGVCFDCAVKMSGGDSVVLEHLDSLQTVAALEALMYRKRNAA